MPTTVISQTNCFNSGSDLWILPELLSSRLAQRIDWYVNFQISKSLRHKTKQTSQTIQSILEKCELPAHNYHLAETKYLMLASHSYLPNRWTVLIPGSNNINDWCQNIHNLWKDLKNPSFRTFLPIGVSTNDFQKSWSHLDSLDDFSLVVD